MIAVNAANSKEGKVLVKNQADLNLLAVVLTRVQEKDEAVNQTLQEGLKAKAAVERIDRMFLAQEANVVDVNRPFRFSQNFEIKLSIIG
jgi:thymidine phosphorylase